MRAPGAPIVLVWAGVKDPQNLGALFRLADAAGIRRLILRPGSKPENWQKVQRVARRADRHVRGHLMEEEEEILSLRPHFAIVALEISSNSILFSAYKPAQPLALLVGNEKTGISPALLKWARRGYSYPNVRQGEFDKCRHGGGHRRLRSFT